MLHSTDVIDILVHADKN